MKSHTILNLKEGSIIPALDKKYSAYFFENLCKLKLVLKKALRKI